MRPLERGSIAIAAALLCTATACAREPAKLQARAEIQSIVSASSAAMTPSAPPPDRIVIAGDDGVFEIGIESGARKRLSSTKNALKPRFLPGKKELLFLVGSAKDDRSIAELRHLELQSGKERVIATLPSFGNAAHEPLHVQADHDVRVDKSGERACVELMDRNVNMVSCWLYLSVDLRTGALDTAAIHWNKDQCGASPAPARAWEKAPACDPATETTPVAPSGSWPFRVAESEDDRAPYVFQGTRKLASLGDFRVDVESPSGRWQVLRGHLAEGDYMHFHLVLFDRQSGELFPLGKETWPLPIEAKELAAAREALDDRAADVVGETPVRWLGPEALLVDRVLYVPSKRRATVIAGDVAR